MHSFHKLLWSVDGGLKTGGGDEVSHPINSWKSVQSEDHVVAI